jgi:alkaline phosphatase D
MESLVVKISNFSQLLFLFLLFHQVLQTNTEAQVTFTHGVASGEVTPYRAILWTRVDQEADLTLEVGLDASFQSISFTRFVHVSAATDFTAKVAVAILQPGQTYFYRWRQGAIQSDVGSFKTPPLRSVPTNVRLAFSGDSDGVKLNGIPVFNNFEVLDAVRAENPDFFVYLGDIIYADSTQRATPATTLDEYRSAYKTNREFAALRALLASTSTYAIWDDHEVQNDFAGSTVDPVLFANGRAAFLEYLPLRPLRIPKDDTCADTPLFRVFHWGREVDVIVLDERSCRSASAETACASDLAPTLPAALRAQISAAFGVPLPPLPSECLTTLTDPSRTFLGARQKRLLKGYLRHSQAKFKFIINQEPIQQLYALPYDRWEGYAAERSEILRFIREQQIENVIFLATDIHANVINEVFIDHFTDPDPIASEFVTGPIATFTQEQELRMVASRLGVSPDLAVSAFQSILDLVDVDCRHLNAFSYGAVEVNSTTHTATFSLKDAQGALLHDQKQPAIPCTKVIGP